MGLYHVVLCLVAILSGVAATSSNCRCTPGEPCWPSLSDWAALNLTVGGRLLIPYSPIEPCLNQPESEDCQEALHKLGEDPYWLQTFPGGTESTGMDKTRRCLLGFCELTF